MTGRRWHRTGRAGRHGSGRYLRLGRGPQLEPAPQQLRLPWSSTCPWTPGRRYAEDRQFIRVSSFVSAGRRSGSRRVRRTWPRPARIAQDQPQQPARSRYGPLGFLDMFKQRRTAALREFDDTEGTDIAWTLIEESQALPNGNLYITQGPNQADGRAARPDLQADGDQGRAAGSDGRPDRTRSTSRSRHSRSSTPT